jgi:hypothetical protein
MDGNGDGRNYGGGSRMMLRYRVHLGGGASCVVWATSVLMAYRVAMLLEAAR